MGMTAGNGNELCGEGGMGMAARNGNELCGEEGMEMAEHGMTVYPLLP
jgi:hypothetical protein